MGLLPLTGGRIVLDGTVLEDPAQRVRIPPEGRPIGLMFQDYLLFPHLRRGGKHGVRPAR